MPHHPHDHHDGPHGPHRPQFRRNSQYPEQIVGVLGRLLHRAADYDDIEARRQHLTKKEPGEVRYLDPALNALETAGKTANPKNVLQVMACDKGTEFFQREKERVLNGLNGNGGSAPDTGHHALILPVPHHLFYLLEDITPGKLYVLPGHTGRHEWDDWGVAELPTRSRTIKAELASVQSITFEGYVDSRDRVLTRREVTDLLADLADIGVKPLLRIVQMPHKPHHETFEVIEAGYQIEFCT